MSQGQYPLRVVKVGGSLLAWRDLPAALRLWLSSGQPAGNVLMAGGGGLTDVVWQADETHVLGERTSHWLCIDALALSARLLAAIMNDIPLINSFNGLVTWNQANAPANCIFDPREFLYDHEAALPGTRLPHTWDVTSDSIAARLAETLAADELVLLKSADPPEKMKLAEHSNAGYVDAFFPQAAQGLSSIRFVNLRRHWQLNAAPT